MLKTLSGVEKIDGFKIIRDKPEGMSWDEFDKIRTEYPINITEKINSISFKLQDGPVNVVGLNGCQVDTIIAAAMLMISGLNKEFPCFENRIVIEKLNSALYWLNSRKENRIARGVEGTNKP